MVQYYLARSDELIQKQSWYGEETQAYIMPESHSVDVNTERDLIVAEYLMAKLLSQQYFSLVK